MTWRAYAYDRPAHFYRSGHPDGRPVCNQRIPYRDTSSDGAIPVRRRCKRCSWQAEASA